MSIEAMRMALACIRWQCFGECRTEGWDGAPPRLGDTAIALEKAIEQAEKQEPVAWHEPGAYGNVTTHKDWALANGWEPLYAKREWVGLTDEEIFALDDENRLDAYALARAVESKLKEKNHVD